MIGQFLSNTNESATVSILQNFLKLNKAQESTSGTLSVNNLCTTLRPKRRVEILVAGKGMQQ